MRWFLSVLLLLNFSAFAVEPHAQPQPVPPPSQAFPLPAKYTLVNDFNGMLPPNLQVRLTEKLNLLQRRNGTQIVVLTVPSTGDEGVAAYSLRAFSSWNIGNNGQGNGVLFLIDGRGAFFIRTGAGISGALPDAWLRHMIESIIQPRWNPDHYLEALEAGIDAMIQRANGENTKPAFWDTFEKERPWQEFAWLALGIAALTYAAYAFGWRSWRHQPLLPLRAHARIALPLLLTAVGIAIWPDPLADLLKRPSVNVGKGDIQTFKLAKERLNLGRFSVSNRYTILVVTDPQIDQDSPLRKNLTDFTVLRPDVAIRFAYLDFKDWNTGGLRYLYGQEIGILPYFMIFRPNGSILAADKDSNQQAASLIDAWYMMEARRQAEAELCARPALGC